MSSFESDKNWGEKIEKAWAQYLKSKDSSFEFTFSEGKVSGWDVMAKRGNDAKFYECKWDSLAQSPWIGHKDESVRMPTGNLFIEHKNPRTGVASGIMASTSDWWVYVMKQAYEIVDDSQFDKYKVECLVMDTKQLREFVVSNEYRSLSTLRDTRGGKVNAEGWVVPIAHIKGSGITQWSIDFTPYIRVLFL